MTVEDAVKTAAKYPRKECHIFVDARDVLDALDEMTRMYEDEAEECNVSREGECRALEYAQYYIKTMNIESPYRVRIMNECGNIETFVPEEEC